MSTVAQPLVSLRAIDGKLYDLRRHLLTWARGGMWANDQPTDEFVSPLDCLLLVDELLLMRFELQKESLGT